MSSVGLMIQTAARSRPTYGLAADGTPIATSIADGTTFPCSLQLASSSHIIWKGRPIGLNSFTLYYPEAIDLLSKDEVTIDGAKYECDGDGLKEVPQADHKVIRLERKV